MHPGTKVVRNGRRAGGHRQSFRCHPAAGRSHDFIEPLTTDLIGTCFTCQRDWDGGFPVARHGIFSVPVIADFMRNLGRGYSLRMAGRVSNLVRLDVRLGLLALTANRQDRRSTQEGTLRAAIPTPIRRPRLHRRSLDGEFYDRAWLWA